MLPHWWKKHFLGIELAMSFVIVAIFYIIIYKWNLESQIMVMLENNRSSIYSLVASVSGSLLGFTFTGLAILLALADGNKLGILTKSKHYPQIYKVYISTIKVLAIATVLGLISLIYDRESAPKCFMLYFNLLAVVAVCFRLLRCLWILEKIILIATKPQDGPAENA